MNDIEIEIIKLIFPPDGAVPAERLDNIEAIRTHIRAAITLAAGKLITQKQRHEPVVTKEIVRLRDSTPHPT